MLLAGYVGTEKTILGTESIYHGAVKYNEKGVYPVLEEDSSTLKKNMRRLGDDLEKLETESKIQMMDVESLKGAGLSSNSQLIIEIVAKMDARRLVIDSLSALLLFVKKDSTTEPSCVSSTEF